MVRVQPKVLTVEEANKHRFKKENQCLRCEKVAPDEPLVKEEVTQLKAFLRNKEHERAEPLIDQATLIISVIQSMFT